MVALGLLVLSLLVLTPATYAMARWFGVVTYTVAIFATLQMILYVTPVANFLGSSPYDAWSLWALGVVSVYGILMLAAVATWLLTRPVQAASIPGAKPPPRTATPSVPSGLFTKENLNTLIITVVSGVVAGLILALLGIGK